MGSWNRVAKASTNLATGAAAWRNEMFWAYGGPVGNWALARPTSAHPAREKADRIMRKIV